MPGPRPREVRGAARHGCRARARPSRPAHPSHRSARAPHAAEPRQLDMTTHDDEAWLRGFAPRRSRALGGSAADSRLDGMKRAKRSSERPAASKPPSADVAKASDSADEPPAAAAAPSGPADPDGRTGARRGRRSRAARAAQPADEAAEPAPEALPPLPSPGSLHGMTCPQLRELARAHAMPISGTKVRRSHSCSSAARAHRFGRSAAPPARAHAVARLLPARPSVDRRTLDRHRLASHAPVGARPRAALAGAPSPGWQPALARRLREHSSVAVGRGCQRAGMLSREARLASNASSVT